MPRRRTNNGSTAQAREIKQDLQTLRDDFSKLTKQMERLASEKSDDLFEDVKGRLHSFAGTVDELIANLGDRGSAALGTVDALREDLVENVEGAVRERPLTTLAVAIGVGFVLSSAMRGHG